MPRFEVVTCGGFETCMATGVTVSAPRAGRREWIWLGVLVFPTLLVSMDLTVLHLAVPELSADLQPSASQLLWIVDIYGFLIAGSLITMGTLGDRIGRCRLLLTGAAAFGIASTLAALSTSAEMLIATRALLGVAAASLMPSTLALIRNMFVDSKQRAVAIAVWAATFSAGTAIGPVLGGVLLNQFWWGSVFLLAVPVTIVLLVAGPVLLPEFKDPDAGRLDLTSAALSLAAVLTVIYGLKQIAEHGVGWPAALAIVAGAALGFVFLVRQRALRHPLIDLGLFRIPAFSASLSAETLALFAWVGTFLFLAQYLQLVVGLSPLQAGLWMLPATGGSILGSMLAPVLARSVRPGYVMGAGLLVAAAGFAILTQIDVASGLTTFVVGSVVASLGIAPTVALGTDMIVGAAPPEQAGAASAISETGTELGLALGVAIIGSVGAATYRKRDHRRHPGRHPQRNGRNSPGHDRRRRLGRRTTPRPNRRRSPRRRPRGIHPGTANQRRSKRGGCRMHGGLGRRSLATRAAQSRAGGSSAPRTAGSRPRSPKGSLCRRFDGCRADQSSMSANMLGRSTPFGFCGLTLPRGETGG
jgi:MFS transporter, DHA2 family, multidrug resistance protein